MIQPITSDSFLDGSANETTHGCIRLVLCGFSAPEPVICVKSYGMYQWQSLRELSGQKWRIHREKISDMIPYLSSTVQETSHTKKKLKNCKIKRERIMIVN